jgi:hypothetical protein
MEFLIAIIAAIVAAVVLCVTVIKKYKKGLFSPIYPLEHYTRLNLTEREDRFLHRHVTKVRVQSSDNNKK